MQYNKMCLICYVNAYHYKLNVNADKCNKKIHTFTNTRTYRQFNTSTSMDKKTTFHRVPLLLVVKIIEP